MQQLHWQIIKLSWTGLKFMKAYGKKSQPRVHQRELCTHHDYVITSLFYSDTQTITPLQRRGGPECSGSCHGHQSLLIHTFRSGVMKNDRVMVKSVHADVEVTAFRTSHPLIVTLNLYLWTVFVKRWLVNMYSNSQNKIMVQDHTVIYKILIIALLSHYFELTSQTFLSNVTWVHCTMQHPGDSV